MDPSHSYHTADPIVGFTDYGIPPPNIIPIHSSPSYSSDLSSSTSSTYNDQIPEIHSQPSVFSYDEVFPALPKHLIDSHNGSGLGQWNQKLRVGSTTVTQVFSVPYDERRESSERFGDDSMKMCSDIARETGAQIELAYAKDQSLTFVIKGKQDAVMKAKRLIQARFQSQSVAAVSIPKSQHRHVLGKSGLKLQELEKLTGTKISVPNVDDPSDKISVTGPKMGVDAAIHEIQIISDQQMKQAYERLEVNQEYHPFINGPYNENINNLKNKYGVRINVPPPSVNKSEISIAGDAENVKIVKDIIMKHVEKLALTICPVSLEVAKAQHRFIIGQKGSGISEILKQTGVSVEVPPPDSDSDTIKLRGERDQLGEAIKLLYARANSVKKAEIDVPAWVHKHIIGKKGSKINEFSANHPKVHVEFADDKIKLEGSPEELVVARDELTLQVRELLMGITYEELNIDMKHHRRIIGKGGQLINRIKDETGAAITIADNEHIIRIEGSYKAVQQAKMELLDIVQKLDNEREKDIIIDSRFHGEIIGPKGEKIREIRDMFNQVQISFPVISDKTNNVKVRGPKEDVEQCCQYLLNLYKDLLDNKFRIEMPVDKQFLKFVNLKGRNQVFKKIRDETGVRITVPSEGMEYGSIELIGKKEWVEEARVKIEELKKESGHLISVDIIIPAKFHNALIGKNGKFIQSIMEDCGNVDIRFPAPETKSDKVTICGSKEGVDKAKKFLIEYSNEKQLSSFSAEVFAKPQHHRFLIGKAGSTVNKIRESTGARIVFPTDKDANKDLITILGKKEAVEKAKVELSAMIKELDKVVESEVKVDPRHHRHFILRRGEVLRQISDQFGGVIISFPRAGDPGDTVKVKGLKDCVEAAKGRILEIVSDLEQITSIECIVPQIHHRSIMGPRGTKIQQITREFDVMIKFPDRANSNTNGFNYGDDQQQSDMVNGYSEDSKACDVIKITGRKENCERAKQTIIDLVPITIDVVVPFEFHRYIIGQKGRDVRELMGQYNVNISVPPPVDQSDIIKVSGPRQNVEDVKALFKERVVQFEKDRVEREAKSFEIKIEVDPEFHPKIIGRGGLVITKIRKEHDVNIQFKKKGDPDEQIITITGYEDNAHKAKEAILALVTELNDMVREEVEIDSRVHSRIIGTHGRAIRQIMDKYKVEVKLPRRGDPNPNLVVIMGSEENVALVKDRLLDLEEEFMQDVTENEYMQQYIHQMPGRGHRNSEGNDGQQRGSQTPEFALGDLKGAPWQKTLNTSSIEDFPSIGSGESASPSQSSQEDVSIGVQPAERNSMSLSGAWAHRSKW